MNATDALFNSFNEKTQAELTNLFEETKLTSQDRLEVMKAEADLILGAYDDLFSFLDLEKVRQKSGKRRGEEVMRQIRERMHLLRYSETDYSDFKSAPIVRHRDVEEVVKSDEVKLVGRCPCPVEGEKTRCCNLTTLDAVSGCTFGCAYCSVQSFYNAGKIDVVGNLEQRLRELDLSCHWHFGTGQASDSLLLGDSRGTLSALAAFACENPQIIVELKSKSANIGFYEMRKWPRNLIFTWSLNAQTIFEKEEHFTASPEERIKAARKIADGGNLVGFHIHPMIYFKGWQEEYSDLVQLIEKNFSPEEICMISFGTLTFTKAVLQQLRVKRHSTRVLSIPLERSAGKYTYTNEIKEKLFRGAFDSFSQEFKDNIFFYLCMEDPALWPLTLGREYGSNKEFEEDMKRSYLAKL